MPPEVNVATDPLIVYGMVAAFGLAIVLAIVFARPRRGLGAVSRSDVPDHMPGGWPWMPGGDISGRDPQPGPEQPAVTAPWQPTVDPWPQPSADQWAQPAADEWPAADPWQPAPPAAPADAPPSAPPAGSPPPAHDPWSTGATGNAEPQPRWDKR